MSQKSRDQKNRWRNKTVGFRVSPEEWDEIERLVRISGMSKQEYIMSRLNNKEITVTANQRVFKALRNEIANLCEIGRKKCFEQKNFEIIERLDYITKILLSIM